MRLVPALCAIFVFAPTVGVLAVQPSLSQPYVNDTIATALVTCLSSRTGSASTRSLAECYGTAETRYKAALNTAYKMALNHVDATSAARLRQSQATWVTFRKDVDAVMQSPWTGERGTIVELQISQSDIASLKARILEIDLVWPGFAEGDEPLEIRAEKP